MMGSTKSSMHRTRCSPWMVPAGYRSSSRRRLRVTGQWAFASGCRHTDWLTGMAVVVGNDGQPDRTPDGNPRTLLVVVPATDAAIVDNWDTLGMRGTGSHDVHDTDVFVPERRTFPVGPFDSPGSAFTGPLYKFHMWLGGAGIGAVALGVAHASIADFTARASAQVPSYTNRPLADSAIVQDHIARATALASAPHAAYLHLAVDEAYEYFENGGRYDPNRLVPYSPACHAVQAASGAVDLVHAVAGTSGIRAEHRLERDLPRCRHHRTAHPRGSSPLRVGRPTPGWQAVRLDVPLPVAGAAHRHRLRHEHDGTVNTAMQLTGQTALVTGRHLDATCDVDNLPASAGLGANAPRPARQRRRQRNVA